MDCANIVVCDNNNIEKNKKEVKENKRVVFLFMGLHLLLNMGGAYPIRKSSSGCLQPIIGIVYVVG
jgi:hypothetical protein